MKKLLTATAASALLAASSVAAEDVKIGVILGFTGPLESITPMMAAGAEMAMAEVTASGKLLDGATVTRRTCRQHMCRRSRGNRSSRAFDHI
jgi:branched-chain amino acid transport system substrate-binding protein